MYRILIIFSVLVLVSLAFAQNSVNLQVNSPSCSAGEIATVSAFIDQDTDGTADENQLAEFNYEGTTTLEKPEESYTIRVTYNTSCNLGVIDMTAELTSQPNVMFKLSEGITDYPLNPSAIIFQNIENTGLTTANFSLAATGIISTDPTAFAEVEETILQFTMVSQ